MIHPNKYLCYIVGVLSTLYVATNHEYIAPIQTNSNNYKKDIQRRESNYSKLLQLADSNNDHIICNNEKAILYRNLGFDPVVEGRMNITSQPGLFGSSEISNYISLPSKRYLTSSKMEKKVEKAIKIYLNKQ